MDDLLIQRLLGAAVITATAVLLAPALFDPVPELPTTNPEPSITPRESDAPAFVLDATPPVAPALPERPVEPLPLEPTLTLTPQPPSVAPEPEVQTLLEVEGDDDTPLSVEEREQGIVIESVPDARTIAAAQWATRAEQTRTEAERRRRNLAAVAATPIPPTPVPAPVDRPSPAEPPAVVSAPAAPSQPSLPRLELLSPQQIRQSPAAAPTLSAATVLYVVQAGSFSSRANAERRRADLEARGFAATVRRAQNADGSVAWKVRVGPQVDRSESERVRLRLQREARIDGFVTPLDS